jgi:hypothetical protein
MKVYLVTFLSILIICSVMTKKHKHRQTKDAPKETKEISKDTKLPNSSPEVSPVQSTTQQEKKSAEGAAQPIKVTNAFEKLPLLMESVQIKHLDVTQSGNNKIKHVSEIMADIPQALDNHSLWRGYSDKKFEKVEYSGIHGHNWTIPKGNLETDGGYTHVSSPHVTPAAAKQDRIIASDLPGKTTEGSRFDLPSRKNVLQVDIPQSSISTTTFSYNASLNPDKDPRERRLKLHGINTVPERALHGRFLQLDTSDFSPRVDRNIEAALKEAKEVEEKAGKLAGNVVTKPDNLVIPIHVVNKKEHNTLEIPLK